MKKHLSTRPPKSSGFSPNPGLLFGRVQSLFRLTVLAVLLVLVGGAQNGSWGASQEPEGQPPEEQSSQEVSAGSSAEDTSSEKATELVVVSGKIEGEIGTVTSAYVKRLIAEAETKGADALFLEMNTLGGRVDAAVAVRDALIDLEIPTLVYINKRAISAGALISLACDKIAMAPGGTIGAATPILSGPGTEMPEAVGEKYLSYFREEMRATAETTGRDPDIAEAMVDKDKVVEGVSEEGKLLTLTTKGAVEIEFVDFEAKSATEALEEFGFPVVPEEVISSWSESLVGFLTSSAVASILFMAMMALAYMEYQTPGFGFFGGGAVLCFLILYFSHYLVSLAGWEEMILFVVGLSLLLLEAFVIPGFGVAGVGGFLLLLASGVMLFLAGDWSQVQLDNPFTLDAVQRVLFSTALALVVLMLMMRFLPREDTGPGGRLILGNRLAAGTGSTPVDQGPAGSVEDLAGQEGVALTPLRPAGKVRIAHQRLEAETEGGFVDTGQAVRVLRTEAGRVIVRRA
ncbi:MAG: ATP-dependent Clp protease proteolytic subunit [Deltaproteobacteria bacterium]|nr:ATP-dependent Clp protease proteolytic subunit [Deltaproteobacteria bacterium]